MTDFRLGINQDPQEKHIFEVREGDGDPINDGWEVGWYFADETEGLNGPFKTREEAISALKDYCERYLI